ncbi:MAG: tetratricopeptide repeat protein [Thermomicrobiales bacterium]
MADPPSGRVAFLFTDLEGSTAYWERRPESMPAVYQRHDAILRAAILAQSGRVYKIIGDAFQAAFPQAAGAVLAAVSAQRSLLTEPWPITPAPRVRMALHVCEATPQPDGDYRTPGLNRLGRLLSAADGGQILASDALANDLFPQLPDSVRLADLGEHRFRDLSAQRVFQVLAPGIPGERARLRGLAPHRDNLPQELTAFVGRAAELAHIQALLGDPAVRILTLHGPGGIGKTRLAVAAAAALVERFPDGAWFVPLAALTDPGLVPEAVAQVFGMRAAIDRSTLEAVAEHLAERAALLVLDNFEQVLEAGACVATLAAACRRLTVLVTSRTPLGIRGERVFPVPPLALPQQARRFSQTDMSQLTANDAVRLFTDRANLVRPGFALDTENIDAIAAICRRLDGLPLAIELAAARTRLLRPGQLLARLDQRLPLLTGGPRDAPVRQQTLRAAIDWSYDLLDSSEQNLFTRLAVFRGGAAFEAIEAICLDPGAPAPGFPDLLERVESLARQSLLVLDEGSLLPRVRFLDTIREYAQERLAQSGVQDALVIRHATYFLDLAERAHAGLAGAEQADWLDALASEHDNLRAALDTLVARGAGSDAVRLAGALWQFWWIRGHVTEGRERLRSVLAQADQAATPPAMLARALDGAGALAEAQGDVAHAALCHEEALALWQRAGDPIGQARSRENLGLIALHDRGNVSAAREHFAGALTLYEQQHDQPGMVAALKNLGDAALSEEQFPDAAALYERALGIARALGRTREIAAIVMSLGALAFFQAEAARAARLYEESLISWRELGDLPGTALALGNLGEALHHLGDFSRAEPLYTECLELSQQVGDQQGIAFAVSHLAQVLRQRGEHTQAIPLFIQGARISQKIGDEARLAETLEGLAGAVVDAGAGPDAARLLGLAKAIRQRSASPRLAVHQPGYERDMAAIEAAVGPARVAVLISEGAAMAQDSLLAHLAGENSGPGALWDSRAVPDDRA